MRRSALLHSSLLSVLIALLSEGALANIVIRYEYDAAGQVIRQYTVDPNGTCVAETRYDYDNLGRLWRTRELANPGGATDDSADRVREVGFDRAGNVVVERLRAATGDAVTLHAYDFANRRTRTVDAEGGVTDYGYDRRGNLVYVRDPLGNETWYAFDAAGRQTVEERYEQSALALRVVNQYDSRANRIRETTYDPNGVALTQKRWAFDGLNRNTCHAQMADPTSADPANVGVDRVTDLTYDGASERLASETTYAGIPPRPRTTTYSYDAIGRLIARTDPAGNTETRTYTRDNRIETTTITEPGLASRSYRYTYDSFGRLTAETALGPPALTTTHAYDALGRRVRTVDPAGITSCYEYNAFGDQTRGIEDAGGVTPRVTEREYDQLGHLTLERTWDGQGLTQTTTYEYDKLGRRTRIDFCDGGAWLYTYDAAGRMIQRVDPRGQVTAYTHNWRGQVLTKHVDGELVERFEYTPLGWMTRAEVDAGNRVTFAYDSFGQVRSETQTVAGVNQTVTYEYDQAGNRTRLGYPADVGVTLTFDHDDLGQTTAIRRNGELLASYAYAGRFLTERAVRTTSSTATWIRHQVGYDVHRRKTLITNRADVDGSVTELDRYVYTYDAVGNRRTATTTGDPGIADHIQYGYDDLHRLTSAAYTSDGSSEVFVYDLLSNRLAYGDRSNGTTTYAHNCVNEYTDIEPGAVDPQYDAAGNLTRTETGYTLAYDYEQRLSAVRDPNGVVLATFTYDALGRRARQVKGGQTTRFVYDGGADGSGHRVIAEYDAGGILQRYYVEGPSYVDEHVVLHEASGALRGGVAGWGEAGNGERAGSSGGPQGGGGRAAGEEFYYLHAGLYSVTGLTDASGVPVVRYTYDAYGLPRAVVGSPPVGLHNSYLFTGRRLDFDIREASALGRESSALSYQPAAVVGTSAGRPVLVLYDYRARAYDPWHGRFCQRDPALYAESLNLYEYALSNPASGLDPSGWFTLIEVGGVRAFSTDWDLNTLDISMSLLDAIRGFAGLVEMRNMLLSELTGAPLATADMSGVDAVLAVWDTYQTAQSALLVGGVVQAGVKFGVRGAWSLVDALSERGPTVRHHGIPMFMGGVKSFDRLMGQIPYIVPADLHKEFHSLLNRRLQEAGFPAQNRGFIRHLEEHPDEQSRAFAVLREVAREFDSRYGTHFDTAFNENFVRQAFEPYGW